MDFTIRNNVITIWKGNAYVATIKVNEYEHNFLITINGIIETMNFKDSKELKKCLEKTLINIDIPNEVYEHIDNISIMFKLTSVY